MSKVQNDGGIDVLNALVAEVNQLITAINALITTFNAHTHILAESTYTAGMATNAPATPASANAATNITLYT